MFDHRGWQMGCLAVLAGGCECEMPPLPMQHHYVWSKWSAIDLMTYSAAAARSEHRSMVEGLRALAFLIYRKEGERCH